MLKHTCKLLLKYQQRWFSFNEALQVLKIKKNLLEVALYRMHKKRWLDIRQDPQDKRKRQYRFLIKPIDLLRNIAQK